MPELPRRGVQGVPRLDTLWIDEIPEEYDDLYYNSLEGVAASGSFDASSWGASPLGEMIKYTEGIIKKPPLTNLQKFLKIQEDLSNGAS